MRLSSAALFNFLTVGFLFLSISASGNSDVSPKAKSLAQQHSVLFVSGLNAGKNNFDVNSEVLHWDFGLDPSAVSVFPVKTSNSFEENSESVYLQILSVYHKQVPARPVVVVGHSEGGLAAALALINHPDLLSKGMVDHVVTIDAPLHGSPIADLIKYWGESGPYCWEYLKPFFEAEVLLTFDDFKRVLMTHKMASGFKSITTYETNNVVEQALGRLTPEQKSLVRSAFTFVVSYMVSDSEMPTGGKHFREGFNLVFKAVHSTKDYRQFSSFDDWWSSFGENDGLVPVSSQVIAGMGTVLGPFEGPHSWAVKVDTSKDVETAREKIVNFTRTLFNFLFDPDSSASIRE